MNNSEPSDNNRPTVPTFIWNVTADDQDYYLPTPRSSRQSFPYFRNINMESFIKSDIHIRAMCIIPLIGDDVLISAIELSLTPLSSYFAGVLAFAKDASTNESVPLVLDSTAGLVEYVTFQLLGDLLIKLIQEASKSRGMSLTPLLWPRKVFHSYISIAVTLGRGKLIKIYCIVITVTFCWCDFLVPMK